MTSRMWGRRITAKRHLEMPQMKCFHLAAEDEKELHLEESVIEGSNMKCYTLCFSSGCFLTDDLCSVFPNIPVFMAITLEHGSFLMRKLPVFSQW